MCWRVRPSSVSTARALVFGLRRGADVWIGRPEAAGAARSRRRVRLGEKYYPPTVAPHPRCGVCGPPACIADQGYGNPRMRQPDGKAAPPAVTASRPSAQSKTHRWHWWRAGCRASRAGGISWCRLSCRPTQPSPAEQGGRWDSRNGRQASTGVRSSAADPPARGSRRRSPGCEEGERRARAWLRRHAAAWARGAAGAQTVRPSLVPSPP